MVERFFSNDSFAFSDFRQALLPINLELQLFLEVNHLLPPKDILENRSYSNFW